MAVDLTENQRPSFLARSSVILRRRISVRGSAHGGILSRPRRNSVGEVSATSTDLELHWADGHGVHKIGATPDGTRRSRLVPDRCPCVLVPQEQPPIRGEDADRPRGATEGRRVLPSAGALDDGLRRSRRRLPRPLASRACADDQTSSGAARVSSTAVTPRSPARSVVRMTVRYGTHGPAMQ